MNRAARAIQMVDPDTYSEEPVTDGRHQWRGVSNSIESAIRKAKLPMYDSSYVRTFTNPKAQLPYDYNYKQRHVDLGLAPESIYPRCDWCGSRGTLIVVGRWAFHEACAEKAKKDAPRTTALKPFTAYYPRFNKRRTPWR